MITFILGLIAGLAFGVSGCILYVLYVQKQADFHSERQNKIYWESLNEEKNDEKE